MSKLIASAELERAERTLQVVYGGDSSRQFDALRVDRDAWNSFLQANWALLRARYPDAFENLDPRVEPAFNTIMTHCLFTGMIVGHNQAREIV
jgi:hypothetical protein